MSRPDNVFNNSRFIVSSTASFTKLDLLNLLKADTQKRFERFQQQLPSKMVAEADFKPLYSVTRAKTILNLNFIPAQQSMLDMAEYFLANNLVSSAGDTAKEAALTALHTDTDAMFKEMVSLGIATEGQVRGMQTNINQKRFTGQYYMNMWNPKIIDARKRRLAG